MEEKEFKKVKSEVQVLGIDDAPFETDSDDVKIVAVLTRGAKMLDGVFHSSIKKDGLDATEKIIQLVKGIKRENARAIILDGVTYGGFNIVDIDRVYKGTNIPVVVSMDKRPDNAKIQNALRNLDNADIRAKMIRSAGQVHEVELSDGRRVYIQTAGISKKSAEEIIRLTTINGLVPEPVRAAHLIAKGAYTEIPKEGGGPEGLHKRAYYYIKEKRKKARRLRERYLPGMAGEVFSFLLALLVAWLLIQLLGWILATPSPLVVVESESMIHVDNWQNWYLKYGVETGSFRGGLGVGDIILVKGDNPDDIQIGDVVIYTRYTQSMIGGEPIIHRVVGIVDVDGNTAKTQGAVEFKDGSIVTKCSDNTAYSLSFIRDIYSAQQISAIYPDMNLDRFRLFITKGDNNPREDQCNAENPISFPVHERLIAGRAKVGVPYLGYVKLGLVCAFRYASGNACSCRCWWTADNPKCCGKS